jgi:hypothetical protein|tara:strand:- start:83 stop:184 length:102 start_codon:yes stop_codon:yes gene_type:complete
MLLEGDEARLIRGEVEVSGRVGKGAGVKVKGEG